MTGSSCDRPGPARVCLILGAGGARGFAHLGVLERLEEEGVRLSSIIGCSVGGLVAAFYAGAGYSPAAMLRIGEQVNAKALLAHALAHWGGRRSAVKQGTAGRLLSLLAGCSFHRLQQGIEALGLSAFDLVRRREVLFTGQGPDGDVTVAEAAIGSAAIPFMFPPKCVRRGDRSYRLVDAGFLSAVPLESALRSPFNADHILAVDLSIRFGVRRWLPSYRRRLDAQLGSRLIVVRPAVKGFGTVFYERSEIPAIVRAGRDCLTDEVLHALRRPVDHDAATKRLHLRSAFEGAERNGERRSPNG
jgi:NTE family protein